MYVCMYVCMYVSIPLTCQLRGILSVKFIFFYFPLCERAAIDTSYFISPHLDGYLTSQIQLTAAKGKGNNMQQTVLLEHESFSWEANILLL